MILFEIENLVFKDKIKYPKIKILKDKISFISGESGCGKSTLLKFLNAVNYDENTKILYKEKPIGDYDTIELRKEVLLCSQEVFLFDKSIKENFIGFYDLREEQVPSDEMIKKYLDICELHFPLDKLCTEMSGGEKQRVFLAICLSFMPKVLMLDEPTSALDDKTANKFFENIISFCKSEKITLICVSHNLEIREKFAEDIINLGGI